MKWFRDDEKPVANDWKANVYDSEDGMAMPFDVDLLISEGVEPGDEVSTSKLASLIIEEENMRCMVDDVKTIMKGL